MQIEIKRGRPRSTPADYWRRVRIGGPTDCWPWQGKPDAEGYGRVKYHGKVYRSHQLAYLLTFGYLPECVCHECDYRLCCNPKHLWAGTHSTNIADRHRKDRNARQSGILNGRAKLTMQMVDDIRTSSDAGRELAKRYNVAPTTISAVRKGISWASELTPVKHGNVGPDRS